MVNPHIVTIAERMDQWREGMLSDTEISAYLFDEHIVVLNAQSEVINAMREKEGLDADLRWAERSIRLGLIGMFG